MMNEGKKLKLKLTLTLTPTLTLTNLVIAVEYILLSPYIRPGIKKIADYIYQVYYPPPNNNFFILPLIIDIS